LPLVDYYTKAKGLINSYTNNYLSLKEKLVFAGLRTQLLLKAAFVHVSLAGGGS
jgi:hypothetical protein